MLLLPVLIEDGWINNQAFSVDLSELEDCSIAVDATYYLSQLLDTPPAHEPLLSALGGLTGIQTHITENLNLWDKHRIVPFFVFNGQSITGQDEVGLRRRRTANKKTDEAWDLYSRSEAEQAVATFGANAGAYNVHNLYPLLQGILKQRGLHFLVPPYNACAQLAYFEMIDSDQCAGVMGPQELLLYPIKDAIIRSLDFEANKLTAISKKKMMRMLGVTEPMFIDALLMTGTTFLPTFPPLLDTSMYTNHFSIMDAVNMLRTSDKSVASACASFNDILQAQDANWLDKYRKARMAVHHFIYIAESGEVIVNDFERLTKDNHEYLGLQLPAELFHYLNTGLIGARNLNSITHGQIVVQPTLDGVVSDEYKKLVTAKLVPIKEQALGLIIPRVHRGIGHKDISLRVWFDPKFSHTINHRAQQPPPSQQVGTWDVKESDLRSVFPAGFAGPIYLEVLALANAEFVAKTIAKENKIRGIDSLEMVTSVAIWRFLHLRGYVGDSHTLTKWGNALATTFLALKDAAENRPEVPGLGEAALLAFELVRHGVLGARHQGNIAGLPRRGTEEDKTSLVLISQCATLLKLRHQVYGYSGPLNKSLLAFRSQSSAVREVDRDLIEAIVASMFMYGQSKRDREDYLEISQRLDRHTTPPSKIVQSIQLLTRISLRLPFLQEPDIGLGIAVRTFFDEDDMAHSKERRNERLEEFPKTFVPFAEALTDDFRICVDFISALNQGMQTLGSDELPAQDRTAWSKAQAYLDARPF
ncbi:XPG I-region protein [Metarhizium album ARSEF 1941]|uniref:XPG I-region protein n=1 Tax=Metarhizium album (strain ARSEF 1941) TaxID=1081103 RepID=A0A0B2WYW9_METAS|nr:XPG I-region protein [Metarhizium album ARSEF 1941]KHO01487.1 XPG I-region protein [Metarhizium album ARSEF 1941]